MFFGRLGRQSARGVRLLHGEAATKKSRSSITHDDERNPKPQQKKEDAIPLGLLHCQARFTPAAAATVIAA